MRQKSNQIEIEATEIRGPTSVNYYPQHAIDGDQDTRYASKSIENPYYQLHFKGVSFILTNYSLQYKNTVDTATRYPRTWELSAGNTNDPTKFKTLTSVNDDDTLYDSQSHVFSVPMTNYGIYSYFRLTSKGPNGCAGDLALYISEIELFGIAYFKPFITCQTNFRIHISSFHFLMFIIAS